MRARDRRIAHAWLDSPTSGIIELSHDWLEERPPPVALGGQAPAIATLARVPDYRFGCDSGFFVNASGEIFFFLRLAEYPDLDPEKTAVYLAGDFNGWQKAVGNPDWRLLPASLDGEPVLLHAGRAERFHGLPPMRFKFVTGELRWLDVPPDAPNALRDELGSVNRVIDPERTGRHLFAFTTTGPVDLAEAVTVQWAEPGGEHNRVPLRLGAFFFEMKSDLPLGAIVKKNATVFRLFAPRATRVRLHMCAEPAGMDEAPGYALDPVGNGVWEVRLDQNLHGWFYWYSLEGPHHAFSHFDRNQRVLDPYALAALGRDGPGIVLDRAWVGEGDRGFKTPAWQDLVIAEAHVRDLTAEAPVKMTPEERRGFTGLAKWVESPDFYLARLGVNCVELQPVQEFDNATAGEYHWGYMTNAFFAPESSYALDPARASGVRELQALVAAFHRRGMAVILDVVYNHVGLPAHLLFLDKLYYFETEPDGRLSNWSGCGNDLRCRSAMVRRLLIDSLTHLLEAYGVDGFRFDLAELIGVDVLCEVETALKQVKPDVVLIAEPWSLRGHLAGALAATGYASWNDGYRNFLPDFVRGGGTRETFEYYLKGSPWYFARWPAQTVNYIESHDDRTWIDVITENGGGDGFHPTGNDRRRTHLMAAILFASVGIPMIAAGQDFLRSKHGVNNTYQRGDLNALDYKRIHRFPATHAYFADWIAFRRSPCGRLLRLFSRPGEGFFKFHFVPDSTAAAVVYNADRCQGALRLLFAVNPTLHDAAFSLGDLVQAPWKQVCDHEHFFHPGGNESTLPVDEELFLPPLGCGLWLCEE